MPIEKLPKISTNSFAMELVLSKINEVIAALNQKQIMNETLDELTKIELTEKLKDAQKCLSIK